MALVDDPVGFVLDGHLLLLAQTLKMSNVKMGLLGSLLGTVLPDVRAKDLAGGGEDDVGASVVALELTPAFFVDRHFDALAFNSF